LHVKCFLDAELPGTVISNTAVHSLPPIIVVKDNQVLMQFRSKDFSFVEEKPANQLHELFAQAKISPNLSQNTAITIFCCLDNKPEKIEKLALAASELFEVQIEKGLTLLTIRHYNDAIVKEMTANKKELLSQKTKETIQVLMKEI
jgi:aspartate kinase